MRIEQRDWLLLRGRLRAVARLSRSALLPLLLTTTTAASSSACVGSAADGDDEDDEQSVAASADALSAAGGIEVIQCNPFYAGAYRKPDRSSPRDWSTARRFAKLVDRDHTHAAVIGMQEIESAADAEKMRSILAEGTGRNWSVRFFHKKTGPNPKPATGEAIYWRPAVFDLADDFGTKEVEALDTSQRVNGMSVRFGGLLLRRKGTSRHLAVFTGKLAWWGTESDGERIDNGDRAHEVAVLQRWIAEKTETHRHASRVVMIDMNAIYGSAPHKKMLEQFQDGGSREPSYFARGEKRLDYVFWDFDSGKKRPDGIFGKPVVSADFGSDHRFVAAKIYVGDS